MPVSYTHLDVYKRQILRRKLELPQGIRPHDGIGAGCDDDLVGALAIRRDEGGAGRPVDQCDMIEVDALGGEQRQRGIAESVPPGRADKDDILSLIHI